MLAFAEVGLLTKVLELAATSIGTGVVVGGFVTAAAGMVSRRSRKEMEAYTLRRVFWGGFWGMFCLCLDLIWRLFSR
jgi:hypothetical protein